MTERQRMKMVGLGTQKEYEMNWFALLNRYIQRNRKRIFMICLNINQAVELRNGHNFLIRKKIKVYIDNSISNHQAVIIWKDYDKLATWFDENGSESNALFHHSNKKKGRGDENL